MLGSTVCGYFDYDTWTLALTIWIVFQLTWSLFLLGVQLYQVAVAMTTNESANANRYGYMNANMNPLPTLGAVGVAGGIEGSDGPSAVEQGSAPAHGHGHGGFCPCLQLVAGARALHKARNRRNNAHRGNAFDHGCWNNCLEFWTDPTDGKKGSINYYEIYNVNQMSHASSTLRSFQPAMEV